MKTAPTRSRRPAILPPPPLLANQRTPTPSCPSLQHLIDKRNEAGIPILQIFHSEEDEGPTGPFSQHSGYVKAMPELRIRTRGGVPQNRPLQPLRQSQPTAAPSKPG